MLEVIENAEDKFETLVRREAQLRDMFQEVESKIQDPELLKFFNLAKLHYSESIEIAVELVRHSAELTDKAAKNFNTVETAYWQIESRYKELRQDYDDMHDHLCWCMMISPRETFDNVILRAVERKEKAENPDGYSNWQWSLRFRLLARLRMAWRLIFGNKDVEVEG